MIYILTKLQAGNIEIKSLNAALSATARKRGSSDIIKHYHKIINTVKSSDTMKHQWNDYRKRYDYAADIVFEETCDAVIAIMDRIYA